MAHRYSVAIKEKYPNSELHVYSDTENNPIQKQVLKYLYPNFYKSITVIPKKKYSKCIINSQFGEENYRGGIHNVPDDIRERMQKDCDKYYNLHIDSLSFLEHDYDFWKYFYTIPEPVVTSENFMGPYFCSQIVSGSSLSHRVESWFLDRVIKGLDDLAAKLNWRHIIIATPNITNLYDSILSKCTNTHLMCGDIETAIQTVLNARGIVGIDSFFRLLGHAKNIPTVTLSKDCREYSQIAPSHQFRWLCWPKTTFNYMFNAKIVVDFFEKLLQNKIYQFMPELAFAEVASGNKMNDLIIKRDFQIDINKSILQL